MNNVSLFCVSALFCVYMLNVDGFVRCSFNDLFCFCFSCVFHRCCFSSFPFIFVVFVVVLWVISIVDIFFLHFSHINADRLHSMCAFAAILFTQCCYLFQFGLFGLWFPCSRLFTAIKIPRLNENIWDESDRKTSQQQQQYNRKGSRSAERARKTAI